MKQQKLSDKFLIKGMFRWMHCICSFFKNFQFSGLPKYSDNFKSRLLKIFCVTINNQGCLESTPDTETCAALYSNVANKMLANYMYLLKENIHELTEKIYNFNVKI